MKSKSHLAFGLFVRVLPATTEYATIRAGAEGLEFAHSIGGDGHKLLNVPYDCGFFFSSSKDVSTRVFQNPNAPYLSTTAQDGILSPLNLGLENSRRFRGLPVYATLVANGKEGYSAMVCRMVDLARKISAFIHNDCSHLELLPQGAETDNFRGTFMCVLFRAREANLNQNLAEKIKATKKLYGSGTQWEGKPAMRFAIAKWDVDVERDFAIVKDALSGLM
jgi:glutamate/tyrosine decarboxylase-like PLP-dependent enzyme